jgi:hypothetical protein
MVDFPAPPFVRRFPPQERGLRLRPEVIIVDIQGQDPVGPVPELPSGYVNTFLTPDAPEIDILVFGVFDSGTRFFLFGPPEDIVSQPAVELPTLETTILEEPQVRQGIGGLINVKLTASNFPPLNEGAGFALVASSSTAGNKIMGLVTIFNPLTCPILFALTIGTPQVGDMNFPVGLNGIGLEATGNYNIEITDQANNVLPFTFDGAPSENFANLFVDFSGAVDGPAFVTITPLVGGGDCPTTNQGFTIDPSP